MSSSDKNNLKILINVPDIKSGKGGVSNHYIGLSKYFSQEQVKFCYTGGMRNLNKFIATPVHLFQYLKFIYKIIKFRPKIIILNPSLCFDATIRDGIYLIISKIFRKKVIVFWHGWKLDFQEKIENKFLKLYHFIFSKTDAFIVLSSEVKKKLISWKFSQPVFLTTTKVDDYLLDGFDITNKHMSNNILFMGRLEENKGIFETLKAFQLAQVKYPDITLTYAGVGPDQDKIRKEVEANKIKNVCLLGYIQNAQKISELSGAGIYILPTYTEGMPTTILEAMAFGIPVITRPVGGIPDFFLNDTMGYLVTSKKPEDFEEKISYLYSHPNHWKEISRYNHKFASEHFMASRVAKEMMAIFEKI